MSTQQLQSSVITTQSALGGMVYPFLSAHSDWQLITRPLDGDEAIRPTFGIRVKKTHF